jgi:peptide/nickel transport system substrate-binding protein
LSWTARLGACLAVPILALTAAACGGSDTPRAGTVGRPVTAPPGDAHAGGTLTVLSAGDVDHIDPGLAYYGFSYQVLTPTLAPLYGYAPGDASTEIPILADGPPRISADGLTITVAIKDGYRFSPPVDRAVTARDVKYAMERAFTKTVPNGYAGAYFGNIAGVAEFTAGHAEDISGIRTPDDRTLVLKLTTGGPDASALVLPITSPVPREYAAPLDAHNPSTYGEHQVSAGPYMVKRYAPSRSITLVRNPSFSAAATHDPRPAFLDRVEVQEGNADANIASRRILDGSSMIAGDFAPPPAIIKSATQGTRSAQLQLNPGADAKWVALNTSMAPFDDVDVRRAVLAVFDRNAMRLTAGGALIGELGTHMLYPGVAGFEQAGGMQGPGFDFLAHPSGSARVAAKYLKRAGFASGRYSGPPILMVGANSGAPARAALVAQRQLQKLGFRVTLRQVNPDTMYTKYCGVPKAAVQVCPNVGWVRDFADPQTVLDPAFDGRNIRPENNANWPQLNDPAINAAMARAAVLTDPDQRATAWAAIDRMVTAQAPLIPWLWDRFPTIESANVNGVNALWNQGTYDLSYTSLQ